MKLTILGSGTMMPTANRFPSSYLLEIGQTKMLLDCGPLAIARLLEMNIDPQSITAIGMTHFHTDHFGGLLHFIHARFVDDKVYGRSEHTPLTIFGPETLEERFKKLREVMWVEPTESYPITWGEGVQETPMENFQVSTFPIRHVEWFKSVGFKIHAEGKSLVYTGDLCEEQDARFEQELQGVDLLLIEAGALTPSTPSKTHARATYALELAKRNGIQRVVLTHIHESRIPGIEMVIAEHPNLLTLANDKAIIEL